MPKKLTGSERIKYANELAEWVESQEPPKKTAYDNYVKDHARRLRELRRIAAGDMPGGDLDE